jgi:hypothetical protein
MGGAKVVTINTKIIIPNKGSSFLFARVILVHTSRASNDPPSTIRRRFFALKSNDLLITVRSH